MRRCNLGASRYICGLKERAVSNVISRAVGDDKRTVVNFGMSAEFLIGCKGLRTPFVLAKEWFGALRTMYLRNV